jgi:hypothetical protein
MFFALFFTTSAISQDNAISNHFSNFIEENNFKISYVSDDMLKTILKKNKDAYGKELTEVMQSITSLHVVTAYKQNPDKQYNEAIATMSQTNYTQLFAKKDQVDKFSLFIKKNKNQISEMVLIARDHVDFVILDITGNINLEKITILGEALHFQGSEFLDQMNLSEKELKKLHIN